ncbi:MAG: DUF6491 family protein [Phenylobacterium sp.]
MMFSKLALAAASLALIAADASAADKPSGPEGHGFDRNQCFYTRMADGFAAPDEHTLNVRVGVRDVYQFEMFGPCLDMDWAQRVALVSRSGSWICNGMDAEVISHATGLGRQRCMVRHMRKLTPEEIAALPKRAKP